MHLESVTEASFPLLDDVLSCEPLGPWLRAAALASGHLLDSCHWDISSLVTEQGGLHPSPCATARFRGRVTGEK